MYFDQMIVVKIVSINNYRKHWREYYLMKHKRKHFGGINIGNFDKMTHVH